MKKNSLSARTRFWLLLPINILLFIGFTIFTYLKSLILLPVTLFRYLEKMYYDQLLKELQVGLFPTVDNKIYLDDSTVAIEEGDSFVLYDGGRE